MARRAPVPIQRTSGLWAGAGSWREENTRGSLGNQKATQNQAFYYLQGEEEGEAQEGPLTSQPPRALVWAIGATGAARESSSTAESTWQVVRPQVLQ